MRASEWGMRRRTTPEDGDLPIEEDGERDDRNAPTELEDEDDENGYDDEEQLIDPEEIGR